MTGSTMLQRYSLLLGGLLLAATAGAATKIYKTVDTDGNVIYTDVAPKDTAAAEAAEVKFESLNQFENPAPATTPATLGSEAIAGDDAPEAEADTPEALTYLSATLASPGNDETVRANNGAMTMRASVMPTLHPGHSIRFFIDGRPVGTTQQLTLAIDNVDRGTHDAQFVILDAAGGVVAQSPSTVFHLQRVSIR